MSQFSECLTRVAGGICQLTPESVGQLESHFEKLEQWNRRMNLTSVEGVEAVVERHYAESLFLTSRFPVNHGRVADIGSGAGFPGFPLAVLRPDLHVALVESNARKCVFLREATRGQKNVEVVESRGESLTSHYDWLISRAVRSADVLKMALRVADRVALLVGEEDAQRVKGTIGFDLTLVERLPWGNRRYLLLGNVSRGT